MPYSPTLVKSRKLMHRIVGEKRIPEYFHTIEHGTLRLLNGLLVKPKAFENHLRECVGASMLLLLLGYTIKAESDPVVQLTKECVSIFSRVMAPGAYAADFLPQRWYLFEYH